MIQNQDLYTVSVDGTGLTRITFTTFGAEKNAQWSPDGQRIAYLWEGGIWVVNADGTDAHFVMDTFTRPDDTVVPIWSLDGTRVYQNEGLSSVRRDGTDLQYLYPQVDGDDSGVQLVRMHGIRAVVAWRSTSAVTSGRSGPMAPIRFVYRDWPRRVARRARAMVSRRRIHPAIGEGGIALGLLSTVRIRLSHPTAAIFRIITNSSNLLVTVSANRAEKNKGLGMSRRSQHHRRRRQQRIQEPRQAPVFERGVRRLRRRPALWSQSSRRLCRLASAHPAAANHVQCGDVITQDTTLDQDLVCPTSGDGPASLRVDADDVTLDLAGHTIDTPGTPAIGTSASDECCVAPSGLVIENGTLRRGVRHSFGGGTRDS